jgi:mono/diheme cytochrome c family protein
MKRIVMIVALGGLVLAICGCGRQESPPPAQKPAATQSAPTAQSAPSEPNKQEQIARGEYLAQVGDCFACHTVRGGKPYAGGLPMVTPFGTLYTTNITRDPEHGIGKWTADDFWGALHEGKSKDGSLLYPAMPFTNYTKVTREDSDAMYAYLMNSVPPAPVPNRPHEMGFPYNQRQLMHGWRLLFFKQGVFQENPKQSKEWNRGAYLVEGLGHCNACHATRNVFGAITADDDFSGGLIPVQNWYARSLTSSRETGLGDWDIKEIVDLLRTGVSARGAVFGPMSAVVQHSLQNMTISDLTAMAVYLKSQVETAPPEPRQVRPTGPQAEAMMVQGRKIYEQHCQECHQAKGEGVPRIYPPLQNNESINMKFPINAIRIVLNGGFPPSTEGNPRPYGMPPFYQDLSDQEVAAVVTFIRQSWGNNAPPVSPAEVARGRGVPVD